MYSNQTPGSLVTCPHCYREVRIPGMPPTSAPKKSRTAAVIVSSILATAALVGLQLYIPRSLTQVESIPLAMFVNRLSLYLAAAIVGALVLGIFTSILGLVFKKPFSRTLGTTYSLIIIPLALGICGWDYLVSRNNIKEEGTVQTFAVAYQDQWSKFYQEHLKPLTGSGPQVTKKQVNEMMDGLKDDLNKFSEAMLDENGLPKKADVNFEAKTPTNEAEKLRAFIQSFFKDMVTLQNDYLDELNQAGLETLLSAERISKKGGVEESYEILAKVRTVVEKYKNKAHQLVSDFPKRIDDMNMDASTKASMKVGFNRGLGNALPVFKENWQIETNIIDLYGELIDLVSETRSNWVVENGQFMFQKASDLDRFNAILTKVDQGVTRQNEIRSQSMQSATRNLDKFK
jgi:hypothetical protein